MRGRRIANAPGVTTDIPLRDKVTWGSLGLRRVWVHGRCCGVLIGAIGAPPSETKSPVGVASSLITAFSSPLGQEASMAAFIS